MPWRVCSRMSTESAIIYELCSVGTVSVSKKNVIELKCFGFQGRVLYGNVFYVNRLKIGNKRLFTPVYSKKGSFYVYISYHTIRELRRLKARETTCEVVSGKKRTHQKRLLSTPLLVYYHQVKTKPISSNKLLLISNKTVLWDKKKFRVANLHEIWLICHFLCDVLAHGDLQLKCDTFLIRR